MRKLAIIFAASVIAGATFTAVHADAAPTVAQSGVYFTVTGVTGTVTADPLNSTTTTDTISTGGCSDVIVKTRRSYYVAGATCSTSGTVRFTAQRFPVCDQMFTVTVNGTPIFSTMIGRPCQPPTPAPYTVNTATGMQFVNPTTTVADIAGSFIVPAATSTLTGDGPFTYTIAANFGGTASNRFVYYTATVVATVQPGSTTTVTINP